MKSCLYCGVVDCCETFNNAPKTCKNYMRRAGVSDLIKMGIFTRQTAPCVGHSHELEFTDAQIERINAIIARKKLRNKYNIRIKGGEIYFRPLKFNKYWKGLFYEKDKL